MKNAHLRMGSLQFVKVLRDTTTDITLHLDRLIVEPPDDGPCSRCHLLSVIGNDQEVAAIAAAIADEARFYVAGAGLDRRMICLGKDVEVFRASINVPGRKRPLRHLVAISTEMAKTRSGGDPRARRTILIDDEPSFLLHRLGARFGLPVLPEWAEWFSQMLKKKDAMERLIGFGCAPLAVKGTKKRFLGWLGYGLRHGHIQIPEPNVPPQWHVHGNIASLSQISDLAVDLTACEKPS